MVFSSTVFLFLFLPFTCVVYFLIPARRRGARNVWLLLCSLGFYFYGEGGRSWIILLSVAANYALALPLPRIKRRKPVLALAIAVNLGLLGFYKYLGFFLENCSALLGLSLQIPEIVMPLGISFFTFQGMSYVIDVYRGAAVQKNPINVALYITLYPQLIAGPIVRYDQVAAELTGRQETIPGVYFGFEKFVLGLGKKVLLANPLGAVASELYALPAEAVSTPLAWLAAAAFSLQLYFDFSGYSDMAVGLGSILGFHFPENFDHPYCARSITEFWRRWHITLGSWFRDYVYIPLGGSRRGWPIQLRNLLIVWLLTGLWHGASWNFVLWGLYFAVLLILEKKLLLRHLERSRVWSHVYCLILVMAGWVLFNNTGLSNAAFFLKTMFVPSSAALAAGYWRSVLWDNKIVLLLGILCATPLPGKLFSRERTGAPVLALRGAVLLGLLAVCIVYLVSTSFNPFLYFRF